MLPELAAWMKNVDRELERLKCFDVPGIGGNLRVSTNNVSNPPTEAEITAAFGAPATVGGGRMFLIIDNGSTSNEYLCVSDGSTWQILALTKAV